MRHTIHRTPEGYPCCQAQYRDGSLLDLFARALAAQLASPAPHHPAALAAPAAEKSITSNH